MDCVRAVLYFLNMDGLRINTAGRFPCAPDWSWDTALHPWSDSDLWTVLAGTGRLETPEGAYALGRGDVFVLRGSCRYVGSHDPRAPLVVYAVHFERARQGATLPALHRRILPMDFFAEILERLIDAHLGGRREQAVLWLQAALAEIALFDGGGRYPPREKSRAAAMERLALAMRTHPHRRHGLGELAAEAGCSPQHVIRLFRAHTGLTPRQYEVRSRIEAARSLLADSSHPLKRIAEILGYRDEYYFSRQFRAATGSSPGAYRRSIRPPLPGGVA
jgi:AraC family transcriptional regulator, arabinose operon regulatory protein